VCIVVVFLCVLLWLSCVDCCSFLVCIGVSGVVGNVGGFVCLVLVVLCVLL
jgi:hypothetical protein